MGLRVDIIADSGWAAEGLAAALLRATQATGGSGVASVDAITVRPVSLERWLAEGSWDPDLAPELIVALLPDASLAEPVLDRLQSDAAVLWLYPASEGVTPFDVVPNRPVGRLPADATDVQVAAAVNALAHGLSVSLPSALPPSHTSVSSATTQELAEPLTARELEVLELMAKGLANREIAEALGISSHTAKFHVAQILDKTGSATRTEAVRQGLRLGLIGL